MTDPQELANQIGATQRATEAAIAAGDLETAAAQATAQHQNLATGFAYLRDELGLELDWDQIAGNDTGGPKGGTTSGGSPKESPPNN